MTFDLSMLREESKPNMKLLPGRAFLHGLELEDKEMILLFARAFLVHVLMNGALGDNAS
ncbi:MAG: hypothetical protein JSV43_03090 [Methanobacteriota archaeon]|nr:MAG: hypothetical protein JSV43_03090 [Euryarchaeota archaeon]